ncbi:MAG: hypothetical protein RLZZ224_333 [Verrucomicrobiota bacterium]
MKPKNVFRGLSSMPVPDQRQNTPVMGIGRVSRIHRTYKGQRKRSRSKQRNKAHILMRYLRVILTLATLVFIGGVVWILYQQVHKTKAPVTVTKVAPQEVEKPTITPKECVWMIEKWLTLNDIDALRKNSRLVHLSPQEALEEIQKFRATQGKVKRVKWLGTDQSISLAQEKVLVSYESGHYRVASLICNAAGQWQVDLESFIAHQSKPWNEIMRLTEGLARVRVLVRQDSYFNGPFLDESTWSCYALSNSDQSDVIYGYTNKTSAAYLALQDIVSAKPNVPVILEISRSAEMLPSQYEIQKVIERGWVETQKELNKEYEVQPKSSP